ncbi:hypothetical protein [Clostridium oryzae]|uniref:Uncharacterized protein n=1 Tax=Clostridium oryzae TaxID=1450648 RepID=A0A1V4IWN6_9CLOT|nr:hypothetical protein [Clostridium oryzae]OPJ63837.1 hypothetical protein CLORY_10210 [Clostridium oryzae]
MRRIHRIMFILCILIIFAGVLKVNIEFNRLNGNAHNKKNYEGIYKDNRKNCDAFAEFTLNRKTGNKAKLYIDYSPIDIRVNIGKKVVYINGTIFSRLKEKVRALAHGN